jgi:hypothetical protein
VGLGGACWGYYWKKSNCWLVNDRCLRPHVRGLKQADTALGLDDKGVEAFPFSVFSQ